MLTRAPVEPHRSCRLSLYLLTSTHLQILTASSGEGGAGGSGDGSSAQAGNADGTKQDDDFARLRFGKDRRLVEVHIKLLLYEAFSY